MNKTALMKELEPILSDKEIEVVLKRLDNKHISQTESNYLARSIRPKLRSAEFAASIELLSLLDYRRKKYEREDSLLKEKILAAVQDYIRNVKAIILFGSYIRNRHTNYRDIDVMVVLNKKSWKSSSEKNKLEKMVQKAIDVKTDIKLISYNELISLMPYSPLLQTELEEHKVIYGSIQIKADITPKKEYLHKKLLEAEYAIELGKKIKPRYIYNAIRNCLAIKLYIDKTVDNKLIITTIENNIGKLTAESLLDNQANPVQRDIALRYLDYLYNKLSGVLA